MLADLSRLEGLFLTETRDVFKLSLARICWSTCSSDASIAVLFIAQSSQSCKKFLAADLGFLVQLNSRVQTLSLARNFLLLT